MTANGIARAGLDSVYVNPFRFTGNSVRSTVDVLVQNPNPIPLQATLRLLVTQPNGVTLTVVVPFFRFPGGVSAQKVFVPYDVDDVRRAWLTNVADPNH